MLFVSFTCLFPLVLIVHKQIVLLLPSSRTALVPHGGGGHFVNIFPGRVADTASCPQLFPTRIGTIVCTLIASTNLRQCGFGGKNVLLLLQYEIMATACGGA